MRPTAPAGCSGTRRSTDSISEPSSTAGRRRQRTTSSPRCRVTIASRLAAARSGRPHPVRVTRTRHELRLASEARPGVWWQVKDSNLRRHKPTDLQSAPIGRSGNLPWRPPIVVGRAERENSAARFLDLIRSSRAGRHLRHGRLVVRHRQQARPAGDRQRDQPGAGELTQRFDFKNTGATIEWSGDHGIEISANADDRATAVLDVFKDKLIKRSQSLKILEAGEPAAVRPGVQDPRRRSRRASARSRPRRSAS